MLIVIPISSADSALTDSFTSCLTVCGKYQNHELLVVCRQSDTPLAADLINKILQNNTFKKHNLYIFEEDGPLGWPAGPNFYWTETIKFLKKSKNLLPWLWMELDCTPLVPEWADKLEEEYKECKSPFLGMLAVNHMQENYKPSSHLVGVAIYPPQICEFSNLWENVRFSEKPFDVFCEKDFVPLSTESKIMQHGFRTSQYTITKEQGIRGVQTNIKEVWTRHDQPIRPEAVLHHGCEDGSLAEIIYNKLNSINGNLTTFTIPSYGPRNVNPSIARR